MPYAAIADLQDRVGADPLLDIAYDDTNETLDTDRINKALADAEAEMNSYIAARYTLPVSNAPILVAVCCDLTLYRLYTNRVPEEVKEARKERLSWLRDLATGKATLGMVEPQQSSAGKVVTKRGASDRKFTRDTMAGF